MPINEIVYHLLAILALVSLSVSGLVFAYHIFLAFVAWLPERPRAHAQSHVTNKFVIVIPAHNEEHTLSLALTSCEGLHYPKGRYDVYVIADNCSDSTAAVAYASGVNVLVRNDPTRIGKGYAIRFAFDHILATEVDVICILDADCTLDSSALSFANERINAGASVLQCNNRTGNCDDNAISLLLGVANALENDLYYAPKSRLGLFVPLRGTGMFMVKEILCSYPWNAKSVVEDTEYSIQLALEGVKVDFMPEVAVRSAFPSTHHEMSVQRKRWLVGGVATFLNHGKRLFNEGLRRGSIHLIDAALSPLVSTRPLIIAQLLLTFVLGAVLVTSEAYGDFGRLALQSAELILVGYLLYVAAGLLNVGCTWRRCRLILHSPLVVANYLWLSAKSLRVGSQAEWVPTPRNVKKSEKK